MEYIYLTTPPFDIEYIEDVEADDGLLWIDSSIVSINSSRYFPDIPEKWKISDLMGPTIIDLSMLGFVSYFNH